MTLDNRHKFARPYWARPGVALLARRADDNDGGEDLDDEDDDSEDDDDDSEDDDEDADKSEDDLRAELKTVRESLSRAGGSVKSKRDRIKTLRRELDEARAAKKPPATKAGKSDDKPEVDVEEIRTTAERDAKKAADDRIKKAEVRSALVASGVARDVAADLVGFARLDDLDIDGDDVDGLDDEIARIREKYSSLFAPKTTRRRQSVAGDGDRSGKPVSKKALTPSELQAQRLTGKR